MKARYMVLCCQSFRFSVSNLPSEANRLLRQGGEFRDVAGTDIWKEQGMQAAPEQHALWPAVG
jgi:hypothetical protein